ncbi:MAG: AraC family transcriptional regulator, partial [Bacteroidota bacterium]
FFDEPVIGVAFYGQGDVELNVRFGEHTTSYHQTKGLVLSFYADSQVEFEHRVSATQPLQCLVMVTALRQLPDLPNLEGTLFADLLGQLVQPADHYVEGPRNWLTPAMLAIVEAVFANRFEGKTKMLFYRSQMTALLSHYFGQLSEQTESVIKPAERESLFAARDILAQNLDAPPSLTELSRQIGLNSFKLKKQFKALFGVPVFKYLQQERLSKANELLRKEDLSVQEVAWHVGYDSLSSFSNAFAQQFGFRPSEIKR